MTWSQISLFVCAEETSSQSTHLPGGTSPQHELSRIVLPVCGYLSFNIIIHCDSHLPAARPPSFWERCGCDYDEHRSEPPLCSISWISMHFNQCYTCWKNVPSFHRNTLITRLSFVRSPTIDTDLSVPAHRKHLKWSLTLLVFFTASTARYVLCSTVVILCKNIFKTHTADCTNDLWLGEHFAPEMPTSQTSS